MYLMKKPTIADVAEKAGVSKPTVSRFIKQENVKPEIAQKIQEAMNELGYVPKASSTTKELVKEENVELVDTEVNPEQTEKKPIETLRPLKETVDAVAKAEEKKPEAKKQAKSKAKKIVKIQKEKKAYRFAILAKSLHNNRTQQLIEALQKVFYEYGCMFQVVATEGKEELEEAYLTTFIVQNVNAVLIESCSSPEFITKQMRTTAIPVLFVRQKDSSIALDEQKAANVLAKYLLDKQHLVIRYLGADEELTNQHLAGIREAYHALKQPVDIIPVTSDGSYLDTFQKVKELFGEKIDLLILQSDEMAIPLSKYLKEYHVAVPQNVSLVSFGGSDLVDVVSPTLTSLTYDYQAYAEYVAQSAFAQIEKKEIPASKVFFTVEERDSVR